MEATYWDWECGLPGRSVSGGEELERAGCGRRQRAGEGKLLTRMKGFRELLVGEVKGRRRLVVCRDEWPARDVDAGRGSEWTIYVLKALLVGRGDGGAMALYCFLHPLA